jgi:hypothetical protein
MALIGLPDWKNIVLTTDVESFLPTTLGYACVDFKFPKGTRYPTLPVRTDNGLVFPLEGTSSCAAPEIYLAKKTWLRTPHQARRNCPIKIRRFGFWRFHPRCHQEAGGISEEID